MVMTSSYIMYTHMKGPDVEAAIVMPMIITCMSAVMEPERTRAFNTLSC